MSVSPGLGLYIPGKPTGETERLKAAGRPARALYAHTPAREFGPLAL